MQELIEEIKELVMKADGWMSDCDGNDHIADALTKLNELEAAMKPKPIESAPKDGTWFLAWKGLWVIVAWDNPLEEFIDDDYEAQRSLTHWLPLPSVGGEE